ncbi:MAG: hypothetical protein ACREIQ_05435 [Nitrospiria bacterium]
MQPSLVIMRDWKIRTLLGAQLKEEKFMTFLVEDIQDALNALKAGRVHPSLIILDIVNQDVESSVLDELHTEGGSIPVLVCSGAMDPILSPGRPRAFIHLLHQPVSIDAIIHKVKQVLRLDKPDSFLYNE